MAPPDRAFPAKATSSVRLYAQIPPAAQKQQGRPAEIPGLPGSVELRAEVIPGALEQIRVPELLATQRHLLLAERVGLADLQRHVLPVGVLLEIVREHERLDDVLADRHCAMRLHQRRRPVA